MSAWENSFQDFHRVMIYYALMYAKFVITQRNNMHNNEFTRDKNVLVPKSL